MCEGVWERGCGCEKMLPETGSPPSPGLPVFVHASVDNETLDEDDAAFTPALYFVMALRGGVTTPLFCARAAGQPLPRARTHTPPSGTSVAYLSVRLAVYTCRQPL